MMPAAPMIPSGVLPQQPTQPVAPQQQPATGTSPSGYGGPASNGAFNPSAYGFAFR